MSFFTYEKLARLTFDVKATICRESREIPSFKFSQGPTAAQLAGYGSAPARPDFDDSGWADFSVGSQWCGYDVTAWFRSRVSITASWQADRVSLRFLVGPKDGGNSTAETLLYVDGKPLQGIDVWHEFAALPHDVVARGSAFIALKAWSGMYGVPAQRRFKVAQVVRVDRATERFYHRAATLLKAIRELGESDLRREKLLAALNHAFYRIDFLEPGSDDYYASIRDADGQLDRELARISTDEIKPTVIGVGHSHIDMAWMWPLRQTREKAGRTFSTVLHLMDQYPEYRFMHSSPQLYQFVKEDYPELYAAIQQRVAEGRWEATGGMWVESDTNLPGGESLVRQILYGKRYLRREFGLDSRVLWLPDSFGFSWAIPQLMARSGLKVFATAVMSWMRFSRFPYDTFRWRGLDGSEVLVSMITTPGEWKPNSYTYIGRMEPYDVSRSWEHYRQKDVNSEILLPFGWGDGGGGPTMEMLEQARALADLPGIPRVRIDRVEPAMARLADRLEGQPLPVWDGELYLESSQGAYTSQARTKQANRVAEGLYHDAEWISALADILSGERAYPASELSKGWELVLLNQFHDILAGTSIEQVHRESLEQYAQAEDIARRAISAAQATVTSRVRTEADSLLVFNPTGWDASGVVSLTWSALLEGSTILIDGQPVARQLVGEGEDRQVLFQVAGVPAHGYRAYPLVLAGGAQAELLHSTVGVKADMPHSKMPAGVAVVKQANGHNGHNGNDAARAQARQAAAIASAAAGQAALLSVTPDVLENDYWRMTLNTCGQIASLYDKVMGREVLAAGEVANALQVFEDHAEDGDAWNVDVFYADKVRVMTNLVEREVEEVGPVRGSLRLSWKLGQSRVTQHLTIYVGSPRIDFRTELDWRHHQTMLKAAFPVAVRSTWATYEIQFGNIQRPTHRNTSFDAAKYEVPAQRWVDLSEGNYGVALLNDAKYGHDVEGHTLRLTLHRSPTCPDANADQGRHAFTYSLLPHPGTWRDADPRYDVIRGAYDLNLPLMASLVPANPQGIAADAFSLVHSETDGVIVETVKRAEDEDAWIVRVYEAKQYRANRASLLFGRELRSAVECNLLEEEEQPVEAAGSRLMFAMAPYEIRTFKVRF